MKYLVLFVASMLFLVFLGSILAAGKADYLGSFWEIKAGGWFAFAWVVGLINIPAWCLTGYLWDNK